MKLGFDPKGKYNSSTGEFELTLLFLTYDTSDPSKVLHKLTAITVFKFDFPINTTEIPQFFYRKAIAIMFPSVSAFITTDTSRKYHIAQFGINESIST